MQIVEPQVDQGADLDIGNSNTLAKVSAVTVVLSGALESAQFLVQPAQSVGEPSHDERVIAVPRLGDAVVDRRGGLGVVSQPDVGLATNSLDRQFGGPVVYVCGCSFPLLTDNDRPLELRPPVGRTSTPSSGMSDDI